MRKLQYHIVRGDPQVAALLLQGAVSRIRQNYQEKHFKVGITNNPHLRFKQRTYINYHDMFVVYETNQREHIEQMERILIDEFLEDAALANERGGGAGRKSSSPYFLYIAMRRKSRLGVYLITIRKLFKQRSEPAK